MTTVTVEGYEFDVEWLMQIRVTLTRLYFLDPKLYEEFFNLVMGPVEKLSEQASLTLGRLELLDDNGHLPLKTRLVASSMSIRATTDYFPDCPLAWLEKDKRPPCSHDVWHFAGLWKDSGHYQTGPKAFCNHCGDHKRFSWEAWKALPEERTIGLPGGFRH